MELGDYLRSAGSKVRTPCIYDCCTFPADWAIALGWTDPMAAWRGLYATEEEGAALITAAGGLDRLFAAGMTAAGIPEVAEPDLGAIGIVTIGEHQAGAIYGGRRWCLVADRGWTAASFEREAVAAIWRP